MEVRCNYNITTAKWYIGHTSMHDRWTNMQLAVTLLPSLGVLQMESLPQSTLLASWQSAERRNKVALLSACTPFQSWQLLEFSSALEFFVRGSFFYYRSSCWSYWRVYCLLLYALIHFCMPSVGKSYTLMDENDHSPRRVYIYVRNTNKSLPCWVAKPNKAAG